MTNTPPTLPDDELRETLDLLSTVMASVSDRVDANTQVLDRLNKTATEARQAAFAAKAQTDPKAYGELVGETITGKVTEPLRLMIQVASLLDQKTTQTLGVLKEAEKDKWDVINAIRAREVKVGWFMDRRRWFVLGAFVLALAMTVLLPRFLASNASSCAVLGASWTTTTTGFDACVFYVE
ncbi:MAG: hypothetical protein WA782_08545 [Sulfitobacter sp.]